MKKTPETKLMEGKLLFININEIGSDLKTLKEFQENELYDSAILNRGNIIEKSEKAEKHIIFDYNHIDCNAAFKLFLYENSKVEGRIEYPVEYNSPNSKFIGNYEIDKNSKITIWGIWSEKDKPLEKYHCLIELSK